jgi:hypothetical protein
LRPAIFNLDVLAIDVAGFAQALTECRHRIDARLERTITEKPDYWQRRLLSRRRERPPGCCAAEQRHELASYHWITSQQPGKS